MYRDIYILNCQPFEVQVGFEFIGCSRNVKRKPYSVCLVIVLLIINIIWYSVYSIYCDIIYETRRWIHAQEGMQRSHDAKTYSFFQCYAHKYKRWVFVVKIIELSPPFDTVWDWIHRYLCWFVQWLASLAIIALRIFSLFIWYQLLNYYEQYDIVSISIKVLPYFDSIFTPGNRISFFDQTP